jgi:hypothetical protein
VWAKKISTSATAMACAACLATAATLPWAGTAAERIANENVRLSAFTDVDAFSAIPLYFDLLFGDADARAEAIAGLDSINGIPALLALLNGNIDTLFADDTNTGYDALSALDIFFGDGANEAGGVFTGGGVDALADYDALSAIPVFVAIANATTAEEAIDALGDYDALSAVPVFRDVANATTGEEAAAALGGYDALSAIDTFFGDGPLGADGETPVGGVFTGGGGVDGDTIGGVDALAPNADSGGGYAALSALPVLFGSNNPNTNFGPGLFNPQANGTGGLAALANYDALSAIPAYLDLPDNEAPPLPDPPPASAPLVATASTGGTGTQSAPSFAPKVQVQQQVQPQVEELKPPVTTPDNSGAANQNITRTSQKFEPTNLGESPFLFGSGGQGVDNSIRGWGEGLKKLGIGGADSSSGEAGGAE